MYWWAYSIGLRFAQMVERATEQTTERITHRRSRLPGQPADGFGRCPVCREFIRLDGSTPAGQPHCPRCGRLVRSLDPLWPE
jgi:hypothetical protein